MLHGAAVFGERKYDNLDVAKKGVLHK